VIEGIDEWKRGGTIERSSVVKGSGDTHRRLIHIWDAEIDFSHDDSFRKIAVMKGAFSWLKCSAVYQHKI
jgi:hypothetical protein